VIVENSRFKAFGVSVGVVEKPKSKSGKKGPLTFSPICKQYNPNYQMRAKNARKLANSRKKLS
jgi:hypothetical protein